MQPAIWKRNLFPAWLVVACLVVPVAHVHPVAAAQNVPTVSETPDKDFEALSAAIAQRNVVQTAKVLDATPTLVHRTDRFGRTPLHSAMLSSPAVVDLLLARQAEVQAQDLDHWQPLHLAAEAGRGDLVQLLLKYKANPNALGPENQTPLYIAASYGYTELVRVLIAAHADVNLTASKGYSALHRAAQYGYIDIVTLLLSAQAELNLKDPQGNTPLDLALANDRKDIVVLLLKQGAHATNPLPAAYQSISADSGAAAKLDGQGAADPAAALDPLQAAAMLQACMRGETAKINELLKADPHLVYAKDQMGYTPLHHLMHTSDVASIQKILDLGQKVDARDNQNQTALMLAAQYGALETMKVLIENGADVNAVDNHHKTALHFAAEACTSVRAQDGISLLLEKKANSTLQEDTHHATAFQLAEQNGRTMAVDRLKQLGVTR